MFLSAAGFGSSAPISQISTLSAPHRLVRVDTPWSHDSEHWLHWLQRDHRGQGVTSTHGPTSTYPASSQRSGKSPKHSRRRSRDPSPPHVTEQAPQDPHEPQLGHSPRLHVMLATAGSSAGQGKSPTHPRDRVRMPGPHVTLHWLHDTHSSHLAH